MTENSRVTCDTSYNPSHRFTCTGFLATNGDLFSSNSPYSKKEDFKLYLENLRLKYESEITLVAVLDNARIHKAQIITDYCSQNKIVLVYLPPYSPQLNPIEDLWRLLKKKLAIEFSKHLITYMNQQKRHSSHLEILKAYVRIG